MEPFQMCRFLVPQELMHPHTIRDAGFELRASNQLEGPSPLQSGGRSVHDFQKEFQILIHLTTEQFFT